LFPVRISKGMERRLGIGEEVVTCKLYLGLAFIILTLERVTIGCCEVGGGGMVGGGGVVCGGGVDRGVGGVVCGFVCWVVCGFVICGGVCWGEVDVVSRQSAMGEVSRLSSKN
ncbi:hypothetical protein Tco_1298213, partial [Tanacetum coccineum]